MADNIVIDNGTLTDFTVSADEAASGLVQRFKLVYSADGSDTHVTADSGGLLVNLGANNDVTVTSGAIAVSGGTVTIGGTPTVSIAGGTTAFSGALSAGTAVIGKVGISTNGTAVADIKSLASGTALATVLYDSTGAQVSLSVPSELTAAPSIGTGACAQYDSLHTTIMTFANAARTSGGTGRILGARLVNKHNTAASTIYLHLFRKSVTGTTAQDTLAVSDTDKAECIGSLLFDFSTAPPLGGGRVVNASRTNLPMDYKCDAGTSSLFGILQITSTDNPTFAAGDLVPFLSFVYD